MLENLANFFDSSGFMPHGHCFFWTPSLLWIYVVSDFIIATSYFSIPFALWYFVRKRPDVPFPWIFLMFGAFVLACGTTHLFAVWNIWHADYWADAGLKALTATVSAATAILLWPLIPRALTIPSHQQLENANRALQNEVLLRKQAESKLLVANEALERRVAERTAEVEKASASLRESEARLRTTLESTRIGAWDWDLERDQWHASPTYFTQLGYEPVAGPSDRAVWLERIHPGDRQDVADRIGEVLRGSDALYEYEARIRHADGAYRWIRVLGKVVARDGKGGATRMLGVRTDISDAKRAEMDLRAAEEQFRGLVEQSIAGLYIIQDSKFAYMNPHFAAILGYASTEELIGRDPLSIVAGKDRGTVAENMRVRLEDNVPSVNYSFTAVRGDGALIEVGVHGAVATHRGRPAIIGLMHDISDKKRAEDEIQRYVAHLETAFMSTVQVVTTLGELRDAYTAGHMRRVAQIAVAIGAELGFDARRQEGLRVAGYLHDIGKITIPAEILAKPGKLSAIEFQLVKGHVQASYDVLKGVEFPWPVAEVALQHHERQDGSGYPQGLRGDAILLEARIMVVADVVEAMSEHRPYRPALGIEQTLAEIERGRGTLYDPVVADACLRLFREKGYTIPA
jgi:PAS domain S-box-containing protein